MCQSSNNDHHSRSITTTTTSNNGDDHENTVITVPIGKYENSANSGVGVSFKRCFVEPYACTLTYIAPYGALGRYNQAEEASASKVTTGMVLTAINGKSVANVDFWTVMQTFKQTATASSIFGITSVNNTLSFGPAVDENEFVNIESSADKVSDKTVVVNSSAKPVSVIPSKDATYSAEVSDFPTAPELIGAVLTSVNGDELNDYSFNHVTDCLEELNNNGSVVLTFRHRECFIDAAAFHAQIQEKLPSMIFQDDESSSDWQIL